MMVSAGKPLSALQPPHPRCRCALDHRPRKPRRSPAPSDSPARVYPMVTRASGVVA